MANLSIAAEIIFETSTSYVTFTGTYTYIVVLFDRSKQWHYKFTVAETTCNVYFFIDIFYKYSQDHAGQAGLTDC